MKFVVLLCFVAMATEVELNPIAILSINFEIVDDASSYQETFETEDGVRLEESGQPSGAHLRVGPPRPPLHVRVAPPMPPHKRVAPPTPDH